MRLALLCVGLPVLALLALWFACNYFLEWRSESKLVTKYRQESRNSPWFLP